MNVRKRNGNLEPVDPNKIIRAVTRCAAGIPDVDPARVAIRTIGALHDGATTEELDRMSIQTAASLIWEHANYSKLAAAILAEYIRKEVVRLGIQSFSQSIYAARIAGLITAELVAFVDANTRKLDNAVKDEFNSRFEYFGLKSVYEKHLLRDPKTGRVIETPQMAFMRIAATQAKNAKQAVDLYRQIAKGEVAPDWSEKKQEKLLQVATEAIAVAGSEQIGSAATPMKPCLPAGTWIQTDEGPRLVADLIDTPFYAVVEAEQYPASGFTYAGDADIFRVTTQRGYEMRATGDQLLLVERARRQRLRGGYYVDMEWVQVRDLSPGDKVFLQNHSADLIQWGRQSDEIFDRGWLLGEIVGDGGYHPQKYPAYARFWGPSKEHMAELAHRMVVDISYWPRPVPLNSVRKASRQGTITVATRALDELAAPYIAPSKKSLLPQLEKASSSFLCGFLRGFFDADGSVQGDLSKGLSIRLSQADLQKLKVVQRMLHRFGIASTVYQNRTGPRRKLLPDGRGGKREYSCKPMHELIISRDSIIGYYEYIGFTEPAKIRKLDALIYGRSRPVYKDQFTTAVQAVDHAGREPVYACEVERIHRFDANGFTAYDCSATANDSLCSTITVPGADYLK